MYPQPLKRYQKVSIVVRKVYIHCVYVSRVTYILIHIGSSSTASFYNNYDEVDSHTKSELRERERLIHCSVYVCDPGIYSGSRVDLVTLQKFPNPAWGSGFINILDEIPNYRQGLMYIHMYVLVLFYRTVQCRLIWRGLLSWKFSELKIICHFKISITYLLYSNRRLGNVLLKSPQGERVREIQSLNQQGSNRAVLYDILQTWVTEEEGATWEKLVEHLYTVNLSSLAESIECRLSTGAIHICMYCQILARDIIIIVSSVIPPYLVIL